MKTKLLRRISEDARRELENISNHTFEFCPPRRSISLSLKTKFYSSFGDVNIGIQELTLNNSVTLSLPGNIINPENLRKLADDLEKQMSRLHTATSGSTHVN